MILVEAVSNERGIIDLDVMCLAELHSMYWAMTRRNKFQSIHRVKLMKDKKYELRYPDDKRPTKKGGGSLAERGLHDAEAFAEFFASTGIPIAMM